MAQEIEEHQKKVKNAKGKQVSFNSIKLNSLLYFGPNNWKMKINGELIKPETKNNAHSSVVVVSVNKSSVAFMLKNSTATLIFSIKIPHFIKFLTEDTEFTEKNSLCVLLSLRNTVASENR